MASGSPKLHLDDRQLRLIRCMYLLLMLFTIYRLVHVSLSQLHTMTGTFEIAGIDKDDFTTEMARIRAKFKQVFT